MTGIDRDTGKVISAWPEVEQSLRTILSTSVGERVMRRGFGSRHSDYQDAPMNEQTLVETYMLMAEAIEPRNVNGHQFGEPRFDLVQILPTEGDESGRVVLEMVGLYYPRGHLGDFTVVEAQGFVIR